MTSVVSVVGSTSCGLVNGILGSTVGSYSEPTIQDSKKRMFIVTLVYSCLYLFGVFLSLIYLRDDLSKEIYNVEITDNRMFFRNNWKIIKSIFQNKPFKLLLTAYSFTLLSGAVTPMLLPYFCRYVVESNFLIIWSPLIFTVSAILKIPLWIFIGRYIFFCSPPLSGKRWKYISSCGLLCITLVTCSFTVKKNDENLFIFFCIVSGLCVGSFFSTPEAMKADIIDYDEFLNGVRNDAKFSGFFMCFANFISGLGLKFALYYINLFGYEDSKDHMYNAKLEWAIRTAFAGFITVTFFVVFFTMAFYPISREVHEVNE